MNRRGFFSTLAGLAAVPLVVGLAKVRKPKPSIYPSNYCKAIPGTMTFTCGPPDSSCEFWIIDRFGKTHKLHDHWRELSAPKGKCLIQKI